MEVGQACRWQGISFRGVDSQLGPLLHHFLFAMLTALTLTMMSTQLKYMSVAIPSMNSRLMRRWSSIRGTRHASYRISSDRRVG